MNSSKLSLDQINENLLEELKTVRRKEIAEKIKEELI